MKTPASDKFYNVGQEWRGVPSPDESLAFAQKLECHLMEAKRNEARMCQSLSIARQTISDQSSRIDTLEAKLLQFKNFAAGGGTVDEASTKLLSAPGGNTCHHCGTGLERDCVICGAPNCCPKCCHKDALETMARQSIYHVISYWQQSSECQCTYAHHPIGVCLKCDMEKLEDKLAGLLAIKDEKDLAEFANSLEHQRDQYAALLCDAMQVVYATKCHGDSTELIDRFEALELTPGSSQNP